MFDSYDDSGLFVAIDLSNELTAGASRPVERLGRILAIDPASVAQLSEAEVEPFTHLAVELRATIEALAEGDVDGAAGWVNELLARFPAHPHLAREDGRWRLHHHPADLALVPMWSAICAEALARLIGSGRHGRIGLCAASGCDRAFVDQSKNGTKRYCSLTCQNRAKTAAFRQRAR